MKIVIIHGTMGCPERNWFPWLKSEVEGLVSAGEGESREIEVVVPRFPTPEGQNLESWLRVFEKEVFGGDAKSLNGEEEVILIGHSIGAGFVLNLLNLSILKLKNYKVRAAFLVSGFARDLGVLEFDELNREFVARANDDHFNWDIIKNNCDEFFIYHSDNDPYVPLNFAEELSSSLDTAITLIPNGGHLNLESGYTKFPLLLEDLKKFL